MTATQSASDKQATATQLVPQAAAKPQRTEYLALGKLSRDTLILGSGDQKEMVQLAKDTITQGRMAEVFVIEVTAHFTESSMGWSESNLVNAAVEGTTEEPGRKEALQSNGANPGVTGEGDE